MLGQTANFMQNFFKVRVIGLENKDVLSLKSLIRIFQMTARERNYEIIDSGLSDIMIVHNDSTEAKTVDLDEARAVIWVYKDNVPFNQAYTLRMPLIGRKIVELLDQVVISELDQLLPEQSVNDDLDVNTVSV